MTERYAVARYDLRDRPRHAGFEVETASSANKAVDLLATRRYAVIVADCVLPDLPVLDWLAALRGARGTTPLVLCSGPVGRQDLPAYAVECGAVAVLEKPFSVAWLVERSGG